MLTMGAVIVFGLIWIMMTLMIPAPIGPVFTLFGILFILVGVGKIVKVVRTSEVQIPPQAPKPPEKDASEPQYRQGSSNGYCPYCGSPLNEGFLYYGVCGRRLR